MGSATLAQWLQRLETLHPNEIDLGLERVASVARTLGLLPVGVPVVTVAGTNGKGSTVAVLEAVLGQAGLLTGVFTSPHLLRFNERIRVGGCEAGDAELVDAFGAIDAARGQISLTYFEFSALAALLVFRARGAQVLVLEVGLGGRLDAVNIVDPTVAVVTRIDLDHQAWLGDSRASIAVEKAGILRAGRPAVIGDPEPPPALLACAERVGATPVLCLGRDYQAETAGNSWRGVLRGQDGTARHLPALPRGPLLPANIATALQAAALLGCEFGGEQLPAVLARARPRGRCEHLEVAGRHYVLDVAHNPAAVNNLVKYLSLTGCNGKTICIFSVMKDKDILGMIQAAAGSFDAWFIADQPALPRAALAQDIAPLLHAEGQVMVSINKNLRQAFRRAQGLMVEGDRLVVFGSFYTVAAVLPLLEREQSKVEA